MNEDWDVDARIARDIHIMDMQEGFTDDSQLKPELLKTYGAVYTDETGKPRVNCPNLAKLLMEADNQHYIVIHDNQEIMKFNGGYYERGAEYHIENRINFYCDTLTTNKIKAETKGFIKSSSYVEREAIEQPLNLINFKNGILDISTNQLIPHDPIYTFQNQIPVDYDPTVKCPTWETFIENVLYPDDVPFMQEVCGYLLYRRYTWALLVILLGHGRNGKTVFLNVLSKLIGEKNTEHIPLQTLAHERFAKAKLYQKHANLCSEIGAKEIKDTGTLKQLTGEDMIFARELYQNGFNFRNYAKLIFSCNILPDVGEKSLAMNERLAVVEFPNTFARGSPECDPDIYDKLTTPEELTGVLNWMLIGLRRLLKNKTFSPYRNFENVSEYLKVNQDPVKMFVDKHIVFCSDTQIQKETTYKKYLQFVKESKLPMLNSAWFSKKFKMFAPLEMDEGQPREGGHKRTWTHVKFRNDSDTLPIDKDGQTALPEGT